MEKKSKRSLSKRYFISRSIVKPQDYDEFWIRYKPERVSRLEGDRWSKFTGWLSLFLLVVLIASASIWHLSGITFIVFGAWLASLFISFIFFPNPLLRFLYPTHIQLSEEGIRYHWFRPWIQAASPILDWDRVSHVTTSDKKTRRMLSILVEFNIQARGLSAADRMLYLLMAPAMSWGWLSSDRPVLKININGIASSDDRKRLQLALKRFLPSYRIEPKVADDLNMYIKFDSYTDMWLETLASSKIRSLETELSAGTTLSEGTYEIVDSIGSGGEALIYRAKLLKPIPHALGLDGISRNETLVDMSDLEDSKTFTEQGHGNAPSAVSILVLKEFVLPAQAGVNARQRVLENIKQEAILWRKLRHPNVVRLMDFFAEDQRAYLVLEYLEGETLQELVKTEPDRFSEEQVVEMALVMCDILGYLHRKKPAIIHRDFTPDNLILDKQSVLKLTDFNIALQLEAETAKKVAGKHAYIPPEQFRAEASTQSDIYAFGCCLHFMSTGAEPEALVQSSPRTLNPLLSEDFDGLVRKCTEQTTATRYQSMNEVKSDLIKMKESHQSG